MNWYSVENLKYYLTLKLTQTLRYQEHLKIAHSFEQGIKIFTRNITAIQIETVGNDK